jgi:hypothetical protein
VEAGRSKEAKAKADRELVEIGRVWTGTTFPSGHSSVLAAPPNRPGYRVEKEGWCGAV